MQLNILSNDCNDDQAVYDALRSKENRAINRAAACLREQEQPFQQYVARKLSQNGISFNREEMNRDLQDDFQEAVLLFIEHVQQEPPRFEIRNVAFRSIKTYLFKCGEYIFLNRHRRYTRQKGIREDLRQNAASQSGEDGLAKVLQRERQQAVDRAMAKLDDNCRKLLEQRYIEGLAPRDIAAKATAASNTISQQILRCREKLKQYLNEEDVF